MEPPICALMARCWPTRPLVHSSLHIPSYNCVSLNRRNNINIFALFTSFIILGAVGFGQSTHREPKKATTRLSPNKSMATKSSVSLQPTSEAYSQVPFNGTISPHFQGNDLTAILDDLFRLYDKGKGEYETTEQYAARLKSEGAVLHGGISRSAKLAFVLPTDEMAKHFVTPLKLDYDADKAAFAVKLQAMPVNDVKERNAELEAEINEINDATKKIGAEMQAGTFKPFQFKKKESENVEIEWAQTKYDSHDYVGSNAFGAKVDVHSTDVGEDVIEMLIPLPGDDLYLPKIEFQVSADVSQAPSLKDRLRVLLICTVREGNPIRSTSSYHEATISEPTELLVMKRHLKVNATEVWIFDSETGKVYAKVSNPFFSQTPEFVHEVKLPTGN